MEKEAVDIAVKGFEFARDLAQQLITLSSGILALTVTFAKDIVKNVAESSMWILMTAWVIYLLSICCGIWTLMALTGILTQKTTIEERLTFSSNYLPAQLQIITFVVGTVFIIIYGAKSLGRMSQIKPEEAKLEETKTAS